MPQTDFYNQTRFIAYPLKAIERSRYDFSGQELYESAILDAGFMLGIEADYDPLYRIKLVQLTVTATAVTFRFQDETASVTFDVTCLAANPMGTIYEVDAQEGSSWGQAWLVAGDIDGVVADIPPGVYAASAAFYVEPATVQSFHKHYVKRFNVASQPDIPWHKPLECGGSLSNIWNYKVTGRNLTGHRKFKPGYNATIAVIDTANAIEIGAGVGYGEGEPCERIDLDQSSSMSMSSMSSMSLSSTSLVSMSSIYIEPTRCKDVFNTINGVWPSALGEFNLQALSSGIKVTTYPDEHKIVVEFLNGPNDPFCTGS